MAQPEPTGVQLDHQEDGEVVQERGNDGQYQHLKVGDLQDLRDDEGRSSQDGRGDHGADPARGEQPTGGLGVVAGPPQQRVGDGSHGDGGGYPAAGRATQEERGHRDGLPRARASAAHQGEGQVHEVLAGARLLQEGAVDGEQNDEARGDVQGDAENPLQPHVQVPDDPVEVVAPVRPGLREQVAHERVAHKGHGEEHERPAGGASGGLQHRQDGEDSEHDVVRVGHHLAVHEPLEVPEYPAQAEDRGQHEQDIHRVDPAVRAFPPRVQQERQGQDEEQVPGQVDLPDVRRLRGPQVVQGAGYRQGGDEPADRSGELACGTLEPLDEFLDGNRLRRLLHGLALSRICSHTMDNASHPAGRRTTRILTRCPSRPCPYRGSEVRPTTNVR
ncbi:hypothetical protein HRbin31_00798 [bacterium HR31]|nr:hypothetical protein HRbin31_00798 [bacterium HR31]